MAYWLFKSEPDAWSWDQQKTKGEAGQQWDGVRNYQARNNMRAMAVGDRGFFYHSNEGKAVVGIVAARLLVVFNRRRRLSAAPGPRRPDPESAE